MTYNKIFMYLKSGYKFGKPYGDVRFPFFDWKLYADKNYIYWSHFGSSANNISKKDLQWIIETIFKMDPDTFTKEFKPLLHEYTFEDSEHTTVFELYNLHDSTIEYHVGKTNKPAAFSFGVRDTDRFDSEHIINLYNAGYFD